MVDSEEYFPSRFLTGDDIKPKQNATVIDVKEEKVGFDKTETDILVVYFKEFEKGAKCNKTMKNALTELAGSSHTEKWVNTKVGLIPFLQGFAGKMYNVVHVVVPHTKA